MNVLHVNAVGSLVAMLLLTGMTAPITLPDTPVADAAQGGDIDALRMFIAQGEDCLLYTSPSPRDRG